MGHGNSTSADEPTGSGESGDAAEEPKWWVTALQKGLAGAAATSSQQQGSPIAPIAPITTGIIDRVKARRAAAKNTPPTPETW